MQQATESVTGGTNAGSISMSDPDDRFEQAAKANAARISVGSPIQHRVAFQPAGHIPSGTNTLPIQRMEIELPTGEEIETKDYTIQELKELAAEYPSVKAEIEEAIYKGEFANHSPQFVTPLFRGVHYKSKKMRSSYNKEAEEPGSTLYSPAANQMMHRVYKLSRDGTN